MREKTTLCFLKCAIMATGVASGFFIILFAYAVLTADFQSERQTHWVYLFIFAWLSVGVCFGKISLALDRYRSKLVEKKPRDS
jgi:hypothetical protein